MWVIEVLPDGSDRWSVLEENSKHGFVPLCRFTRAKARSVCSEWRRRNRGFASYRVTRYVPECELCKGMKDELRRAAEWLAGDDHGISSETIWSVMTGIQVRRTNIPLDWDDFGRCYRLIKLFPEWRVRLSEVADEHKSWRPIIEHWDELCSLHESGDKEGVSSILGRMR